MSKILPRNHELAVQALEHLNHVISEYAPFEKRQEKTNKNKRCQY